MNDKDELGAWELTVAAGAATVIDRDEWTLNDRMKAHEAVQCSVLDPDLPWVVRVDGKAFHTWTTGLERPFSAGFVAAMDEAARTLAALVQGAVLAYVQSDEVTVVVPARSTMANEPWFGGRVQKIASVAASCCASAVTLASPLLFGGEGRLTMFDARVFNLPTAAEAVNCLVWRQHDAIRNSVSAAGHALFTTRRLHGMPTRVVKEMLAAAGVPWDALDPGLQRGRWVRRMPYKGPSGVERHRWVAEAAPKFIDARAELLALLGASCEDAV